MSGLSKMETLHVFWAFFFQLVLITHFALRRWAFDAYIFQYGWIVYALAIPAVIISIILLRDGQPWYFWLSGFLYFVFAVYGYTVEYVLRIEWAQSCPLAHLRPLHHLISGNGHVLLVAASAAFQGLLAGLHILVHHQHHFEHRVPPLNKFPKQSINGMFGAIQFSDGTLQQDQTICC